MSKVALSEALEASRSPQILLCSQMNTVRAHVLLGAYLTQSINQKVLESQLPPQDRQLIVLPGNSNREVDDFWELIF